MEGQRSWTSVYVIFTELLEVLKDAHVAALKNWRLGAVVKIEDKF